jgi:hypothetical protein
MIYLLSWSGRGFVGYVALMLAVCVGVGLGALIGRGEIMWFGLCWIGAGVVCVVLGRKWNCGSVEHKFCGLALEWWGWIYGVIGAFLALIGYQGLRVGM